MSKLKKSLFILVACSLIIKSFFGYAIAFYTNPLQKSTNQNHFDLVIKSAHTDLNGIQIPFDLKEKEENEMEEKDENQHLPIYFLRHFSNVFICKLLQSKQQISLVKYFLIKPNFVSVFIQIHSYLI